MVIKVMIIVVFICCVCVVELVWMEDVGVFMGDCCVCG